MNTHRKAWATPTLTVHGNVEKITAQCDLPLKKPGGLNDAFSDIVGCSDAL